MRSILVVFLRSYALFRPPLHFIPPFRPAGACNAGARSEQCLRLPTLSRVISLDVCRIEFTPVVFHARSVLVFLAPFLYHIEFR